jgi:hypothetical protein
MTREALGFNACEIDTEMLQNLISSLGRFFRFALRADFSWVVAAQQISAMA